MSGPNRPLGSLLKEAAACLDRAQLRLPRGELQVFQGELQEARSAVDAALLGYESSDAVNDNEDELVQEALQVRSKALAATREGEERRERLRREQRDLKAHRKELERACNTADIHLRRAEAMAKQRETSLQHLCHKADSANSELVTEIEKKAVDLNQTNELSRNLHQNLHGLIAQHKAALEENARANSVLHMEKNRDSFKKTKDKECGDHDDALRNAQAALADQMRQLQMEWEQQQAQYRAQIAELQGQLGELQTRYDQKCAVAERELEHQITLKKRSVEEVENQVAGQIRQLEDVRQNKALALRSQIAQHQQRVREIVSSSQMQMEMQISDVKKAYRHKVKQEALKCEDSIVKERLAVQKAEKEAVKWKHSVDRMRENYRAHAVKSAAYVKSLDDKTTQRILSLYS